MLEALGGKCKAFCQYLKNIGSDTSEVELRSVNDKLQNFERNFLVAGISSRISTRHVVYASAGAKLSGGKFPGIAEAIYNAVRKGGEWDDVSKQITLVVWCVDTANRSLDMDEWKRS